MSVYPTDRNPVISILVLSEQVIESDYLILVIYKLLKRK
jgi:hypothetical protein